MTVVVNGSATPSVIGALSPGSGALAISSSRLFCQKQTAKATPKTENETTIRVRSSPRCSTRVSRSSKPTPRNRAIDLGLVLGDDLALDHLGRLGRAFSSSWNLVLVVHGEGSLELADPLPHRLAELWQALRSEDDQGDHQDYGDL